MFPDNLIEELEWIADLMIYIHDDDKILERRVSWIEGYIEEQSNYFGE